MIHLFDRNNKYITNLTDILNASYSKNSRALWTAKVKISPSNRAYGKIEPLFFIDIYDDLDEYIGKFRISPKTVDVSNNNEAVEYSCYHAFHTLLDNAITTEKEFSNVTPKDILTWLLSNQKIKYWIYVDTPTVDLPTITQFKIEKQTGLITPAYKLLDMLGPQYYFSFDTRVMPWRVTIKSSVAVGSRVKEGYNLDSFQITRDPSSMVNRLYLESSYYDKDKNQEVLVTMNSANGGLPYVEDKESVEAFGPKEWYETVSDIHTSAELVKYAKQKLARLKGIITTIRGDVYDFIKIMDPPLDIDLLRIGRKVYFETEKHGEYYLYVVEESKSDIYGKPQNITITLSISGDTQTAYSISKTIFDKIEKAAVAANKARLSANGKSLITSGPTQPPYANEGDLWFRLNPDGSEDIMLFKDGEWIESIGNKTIKALHEDLEKSKELIEKAEAKAEAKYQEVMDKIPGIENKIKTQSADILGKLQEHKTANGASIDSLKKEVNQKISTVDKDISTLLSKTNERLPGSLAYKLNETVKTVSKSESIIKEVQNTSNETLEKMTKFEQTADGLKLDIAKNSGGLLELNTWKKTADGELSRISKIEADFNSLEISGRNLLPNSKSPDLNLWVKWDAQKKSISGTTITMSDRKQQSKIVGYYSLNSVYKDIPNGSMVSISFDIDNKLVEKSYTDFTLGAGFIESTTFRAYGNKKSRVKLVAKVNYSKSKNLQIQAIGQLIHSPLYFANFKNLKVEIGNKPTAWTPAPEDLATVTAFNEFKRSADQTLSIIRNGKLTSQINQEARQVLISAGDGKTKGKLQITKNGAYIEKALIDTAHIKDGAITNAKIGNLTFDWARGKTLDAKKINVVNLDASNIHTGRLRGRNAYWDLDNGMWSNGAAYGSNIKIQNGELKTYNGNKLNIKLDGTGLRVYDGSGNIAGAMRMTSFRGSKQPTLGILHDRNYSIGFFYDTGHGNTEPYLIMDKTGKSGYLQDTLYPIEVREGINFRAPIRLSAKGEIRTSANLGIKGTNNPAVGGETVFIGNRGSMNGIFIGRDGVPYVRKDGIFRKI